MRHLFLLLFIVSPTICFSQNEVSETYRKLEWLVGKWDRTNLKNPGRTGYEIWYKTGDLELSGKSCILNGADTVFTEKFALVVKDGSIYYVADVPENNQPIYFRLTIINDSSFICENPDHDFPKKITYALDGLNLKAQISGNGKSIDYLYVRHK